jgi:hypothetical protein
MVEQQAAIPECRRLPKKEHDLFKSIIKHYEIKQYKKVRPCPYVSSGLNASHLASPGSLCHRRLSPWIDPPHNSNRASRRPTRC